VFTARYGLMPYIYQIMFRLLNFNCIQQQRSGLGSVEEHKQCTSSFSLLLEGSFQKDLKSKAGWLTERGTCAWCKRKEREKNTGAVKRWIVILRYIHTDTHTCTAGRGWFLRIGFQGEVLSCLQHKLRSRSPRSPQPPWNLFVLTWKFARKWVAIQ
jgi:hypothetical protein